MPTVAEACTLVRSKNAGPYWVTIDLFFKGEEEFRRYSRSPALGPDTFARLFGADPEQVKSFAVEGLNILKISYARSSPQGGEVERDMHCGQQFVRLLPLELDTDAGNVSRDHVPEG